MVPSQVITPLAQGPTPSCSGAPLKQLVVAPGESQAQPGAGTWQGPVPPSAEPIFDLSPHATASTATTIRGYFTPERSMDCIPIVGGICKRPASFELRDPATLRQTGAF